MPQDDLLFTLAEVAVGFAGFAGLVTILSRRDGHSTEQLAIDLSGLASVLGASLLVVAFSLLPPVLVQIGLAQDLSWRSSAGMFCVAAGYYFIWSVPDARARYKAVDQSIPWTLKLHFLIAATMILVLALCAVSILPENYYIGALFAYLYFAGFAFVRVFVSLGRDTPAA
jgi:hypothetical protein